MDVGLKDIVETISIIVAALGLCAAALQLRASQKFQRENSAKAIYREYLRLAIDMPQLADGEYDKKSEQKYKRFVSYFLWTCEEVLQFEPNDEFWINDLKIQIQYHQEYLCSQEFKQEQHIYDPALLELIRSSCAGKIT